MRNDRNKRDFVRLLKLFLMILVCMFGFYGWKERVLYRQLEQKVLQEQQVRELPEKRQQPEEILEIKTETTIEEETGKSEEKGRKIRVLLTDISCLLYTSTKV